MSVSRQPVRSPVRITERFPVRAVRRRRIAATALATAIATLAASPWRADAQGRDREREREANAFSWSGAVPAGSRVIVHNVNGPIRVERAAGDRVDVTADKSWRTGDPDDVRIEQRKVGDDLVVCALWHRDARCEPDGIRGGRSGWNNRTDVSVHFTVRVPDGVRVEVHTVNGELTVTGATGEVRATTVNGGIEARSTGGPVRAKTVNGGIRVAMGRLTGGQEASYETVNGAITLELGSGVGAEVDLSVVNGRISTDLPLSVTGTVSPRRLRATIGDGGARIRASTVNGGITIRRGVNE
jgi:hypothetical protein